ncbi:MAG TPA: cytidylate kinase-like family protein [Syntrophorhabdaceae bacterium]|nr:cytidylate kinase-like family protein [Syntrophorhabdaceae bacterium]
MAILTISRQFGSGAKPIGLQVASELGYEYIDRATMFKDIMSKGTRWESFAKDFDEHYPNVWERNDWSFKAFVALIQNMIFEYVQRDKVIIAGTGATFLLKGVPHVLRVRIEGSVEDRIKRIQGDQVINEGTARWIIEKIDGDMSRSMYTIYGKQWNDPGEYDRVFNTSAQTNEDIVDEIKKGLAEKEARNNEKAHNILDLRAIAAKVKAAILTDPGFTVSYLDVTPKEEGMPKYGLIVRGFVHERDDTSDIKDAVKKIAGDLPLEFGITYQMLPRFGHWDFK